MLTLLFQWWWWQKPVCLRFHPLLRLKLCLLSFAMNFLLLISQLDDWLKLARSHMCDKESFSYKHMKQPPRKFLGRCDEDSIKRGNGRNVEFLSRLSHYKASYFSISHDTVFLKWKDGHLLQVTRGGTMNQLTISLFSQWLHLIWETLSNDDRYLSTLGIPKIPSEMEVAPRYKQLTLMTLLTLFKCLYYWNCFTLLQH